MRTVGATRPSSLVMEANSERPPIATAADLSFVDGSAINVLSDILNDRFVVPRGFVRGQGDGEIYLDGGHGPFIAAPADIRACPAASGSRLATSDSGTEARILGERLERLNLITHCILAAADRK